MKRSREHLPLFDAQAPTAQQVSFECMDVLAWAESYTGPKFHAMLCDPPYHLSEVKPSVGQGFNYTMRDGRTREHREARAGFMGQRWDGGDIAFKPDTWKALAQHLLPGAFIMAFSSARTYHRLAVALEDAGLILHPAIGWLQGSGFPKATRVSSSSHEFCECDATSREGSVGDSSPNGHGGMRITQDYQTHCLTRSHPYDEPLPLGQDTVPDVPPLSNDALEHSHDGQHGDGQVSVSANTFPYQDNGHLSTSNSSHHEKVSHNYQSDDNTHLDRASNTSPVSLKGKHRKASDQSDKCDLGGDSVSSSYGRVYQNISHCQECRKPIKEVWAGHRYGLQAMKPAIEFIALAQVPYSKKPVHSITQTGAGALNIASARVGVGQQWWDRGDAPPDEATALMQGVHGRWPPNFALSHLDTCVRVGVRQVKGVNPPGPTPRSMRGFASQPDADGKLIQRYTDANGNETVPEWQCAPGCPVDSLDRQAGARKSGGGHKNPHMRVLHNYSGGPLGAHDAMGIGGDTGGASRFFHVSDWSLDIAERLAQASPVFYAAKSSRAERDSGLEGMPLGKNGQQYGTIQNTPNPLMRNPHPTVKPLKLTQWLATLLLPPAAYSPRRLLIPFAGVASEMVGAMLAGWEEVLGIESDPGYVEIGRARISYWTGWKASTSPGTQPSVDHATLKTYDKKHRVKRDLTDDLRQQNLDGNLIDG